MSKKYKDKKCVYCSLDNSSETGDHVVAREFFLLNRRDNLPKVPACRQCNNEKSALEHYLTAVFPFGGAHQDAATNLATMVPPRLAKNEKLAARLRDAPQSGSTIPLDCKPMEDLFRMITKGLANFHWKLDLPDSECSVHASFLKKDGQERFERFWNMPAREIISEDLGCGTFVYKALQTEEDPRLTVWHMSLYGTTVGGDPTAPGEKSATICAITSPKNLSMSGGFSQLLANEIGR